MERPAAAETVGRRIRDTIDGLCQFPEQRRPGRVHGTRELVVSGTPFIAPYRVASPHMDVLAVLHGARMWPSDVG